MSAVSSEYGQPANGEKIPDYSNTQGDEYIAWNYEQPIPSIVEPIKWYFKPFPRRAKEYFVSMFPFLQWIYRYNLKWLWGDLVAGITVGIVVVPQGMSYARVAGLPVEYGLYSSFIGVMLYCFFATSKDVSIGPVAVMSQETYRITRAVVERVPDLEPTSENYVMVAATLCLIVGGITCGLGLLRLGFLLEYIPMPAVMGFMTGSAFTIAVGQVSNLMGIKQYINASGGSHNTVIEQLKNLHHSDYNACIGILSLFVLYALKWGCGYLEKRDRKRKWIWFYLNTMRSALVIIFTTLISWGLYRIYGADDGIQRNGAVPSGLHPKVLHPERKVVAALGSELPIATVVLVLEHIAISKSFGHINEYRVNPNQELIAIGISNLIGQFFQSYPNTGSFSRTALKNKCGVRTPLAGVFTGACVLIAVYALTEAFKFISKAALSAIIIHAVLDLMASWQSTYRFFLVSPIEFLIFIVDVFLCVFVTLEAGIYFSVAASLVFVLLRQTFPLGEFLGKVEFTRHVSDEIPQGQDLDENSSISTQGSANDNKGTRFVKRITSKFTKKNKTEQNSSEPADTSGADSIRSKKSGAEPEWHSVDLSDVSNDVEEHPGNPALQHHEHHRFPLPLPPQGPEVDHLDETTAPAGPAEPKQPATYPVIQSPTQPSSKWWPLNLNNVHPGIRVVPPPPGILVYRFHEAVTYQNIAWQTERIADYVRAHTKRDIDPAVYANQKLGDRPWNENGPRKYQPPTEEDTRPILRAIIFDMSCSPHVDLTGAQGLWDLHQELTKYACVPIEFHFAGILSPWARRSLVNSGFGNQNGKLPPHSHRLIELARVDDPESQLVNGFQAEYAPVVDTTQCYFHFDIPDLVFR